MRTWIVATPELDAALYVDAEEWRDAVKEALSVLDPQGDAFARLILEISAEGRIHALDPLKGVRFTVRPSNLVVPPDYDLVPDPWKEVEDALLTLGTDAIEGAASPKAAAEALLAWLTHTVGAEAGSVLLLEADGGLEFFAAVGPRANRVGAAVLPAGAGLAGWVLRTGRATCVHDVGVDLRHHVELEASTGYHPRAVLAVPVRVPGGKPIGVLELLDHADPFTPRDLDLAARLAEALAVRLEA